MTNAAAARGAAAGEVRWWVAGDWNGFFGLFTNVVLNVIVLTGLCLGVVNLPADTVFGRILPALGIALPIGNLYYAYLAHKLAQREGRADVTAMPYGPSVPHMFIVVFVIMLPVYLKTKDPVLAWQAGLAWAFIIGVIVLAGIFFGPWVRAHTPRAAMLGTLAGISIAFISLRPAFQMWEVPWIAFISLAIVLISWTANTRLPFGLPGGLAAVIVGIVVGWVAYFAGWSDVVKAEQVRASFTQFGLHLPFIGTEVWRGLADVAPLLVTAIPLRIYNFTEAMNNVESASAAGDSSDLRKILGGHRIGYSRATGAVIGLVCFLGLTALLLAVVPLVAILPILLYIGLVIGAQAFQASPQSHAPAVVLAIIPNVAAWGQLQVDSALNAAGTSAAQVGAAKLPGSGLVYHGMELLGGGAVLAGLVLGALAAFIIDRRLKEAGLWGVAGAGVAFFGFLHGGQLGWAVSPQVALGYALFGAVCLAAGMQARKNPA